MKYTIAMKFAAIFLAAVMLVAAATGVGGVIVVQTLDGYAARDFDGWYQILLEDTARQLAQIAANDCVNDSYSNCTEEISLWDVDSWSRLESGSWYYRLLREDGSLLETGGTAGITGTQMEFTVDTEYAQRQDIPGDGGYYYTDGVIYSMVEGPRLLVQVTAADGALTEYNGLPMEQVRLLFALRYWFMAGVLCAMLAFAVLAVYLCVVAGKTGKTDPVRPGGLNRLPLDIYLLGAGTVCVLLAVLAGHWLSATLDDSGLSAGALLPAAMAALAAAVVLVGLCYAVAAQVKMPGLYWWHNSLVGRVLGLAGRGVKLAARGLSRLLRLLPLVWRYLLLGLVMGVCPLWFFHLGWWGSAFWLLVGLVWCVLDAAIICYGAYAYGTVLRGAQQLAQGDLHAKISTRYLLGTYRQCAEHLNALAEVATVAARKQLRSERMKTELITNVSHDIKTPLTSIISYVDLLEKPHTPQQGQEYIAVLGRQSQRLKKLVEDLMEMSKATTGNISVEATAMDAVEAVNQALGEFADKLTAAGLKVVFSPPEGSVPVLADGRLTWRVLSNLLGNAVKYALPGTRVYLDMETDPRQVRLHLKNISREPLNVSADELTERFVRGDASRNTEGSGLGLNIAKSLMELQKGTLELTVDGDLFKVTLTFPRPGV